MGFGSICATETPLVPECWGKVLSDEKLRDRSRFKDELCYFLMGLNFEREFAIVSE